MTDHPKMDRGTVALTLEYQVPRASDKIMQTYSGREYQMITTKGKKIQKWKENLEVDNIYYQERSSVGCMKFS
jgi:hypothetical protein